jgi:Zn-dependent protease with chaperone function
MPVSMAGGSAAREPALTIDPKKATEMTISATALLTRMRTWLLVAGLTGLVIALGALIGGAFLWLFAALAVIFNLVGYFFSDRIALRVARAEPLSEDDAPEIYRLVRDLARRAEGTNAAAVHHARRPAERIRQRQRPASMP